MDFILRQKFVKQLVKLPLNIRQSFGQKLEIFKQDTCNSVLNTHALKGDKIGLFSINITGDYRAIFYIENNIAIFYKIGRHSELYNK